MKALISFTTSIFLLALTFSFTHAQATLENTPIDLHPEADQLINIVEKSMSAIQSGDFDTFRTYAHPKLAIYSSGSQDSLTTDGYIEQWKGYLATSKDPVSQGTSMAIRITDGPQKGDWVMSYVFAQWTHTPSGQRIAVWNHSAIQIEDGKMRTVYEFQNDLSVMAQMGFKIVPPGSGE